jgi:hypothetical protein
VEAEKSTFRGEPSLQRSWCTAGLTTIFFVVYDDCSVETVWKNIKLYKITVLLNFRLKISADLFGSLELTLSAPLSFENF